MSRHANRGAAAITWAVLIACLVAGCVTRPASAGRAAMPLSSAVEPALVVERFLRAANANDLETMGRLFGTRDGSSFRLDPRSVVEQRMFALASVLKHDDFAIEETQVVPGRSQEAVRLLVRFSIGGSWIRVPFVVVTGRDGWVVEQFDIEAITNPARGAQP